MKQNGEGSVDAQRESTNGAEIEIGEPSETAPRDTAPSDGSPSDTAPSDTAPSDTAPSDGSPGEIHADGTATSGSKLTDADIALARETAYNVALRRNLKPDDAEDLAQTVTMRLLGQPAVPNNVAAWSRKVTQNAIIDLDRKRKKANDQDIWAAREVPLDEDLNDALFGVGRFVRTQRAVSAQGMRRKAGEEMLQLLRETLNERELELLMLLSDGHNQAEIAEKLGYKNADTVKTTLARIRTKIQPLADQLAAFGAHPRVY